MPLKIFFFLLRKINEHVIIIEILERIELHSIKKKKKLLVIYDPRITTISVILGRIAFFLTVYACLYELQN